MVEDIIRYFFTEEINECNICYESFNESFKCNRCTFYVVQIVFIISILPIKINVLFADIKNNLVYDILNGLLWFILNWIK